MNRLIILMAAASMAGCQDTREKADDNKLSEQEIKDGWQLLFDGQTTAGWRGFNEQTLPENWVVDNGTFKALGTGGDIGGDIVYGTEPFDNFELTIEWKIAPQGNSGILYHVLEDTMYKAPYETGPEYQLIDDLDFPSKLEPWQTAGADYAMYPPPADKKIKPAGEWNHSRILFTAEKAEYWLNGQMTCSFVPFSEDWTTRRNSGKWDAYPDYGKSRTGLISLQDHASEVWFRNIKIRKL